MCLKKNSYQQVGPFKFHRKSLMILIWAAPGNLPPWPKQSHPLMSSVDNSASCLPQDIAIHFYHNEPNRHRFLGVRDRLSVTASLPKVDPNLTPPRRHAVAELAERETVLREKVSRRRLLLHTMFLLLQLVHIYTQNSVKQTFGIISVVLCDWDEAESAEYNSGCKLLHSGISRLSCWEKHE